MKKKYYYTIGEVCNYLDVKPYVLRYWEKEFPQLKPRKKQGRNRKYTKDDIELLKKIKYMLYVEKFTIKGAIENLNKSDKKEKKLDLKVESDKERKKQKIIKELTQIKEKLKKLI
jgi:DNA-binding transcriptional MerR regulator